MLSLETLNGVEFHPKAVQQSLNLQFDNKEEVQQIVNQLFF
jgi:hypothetical protein